MDRWAGGDREYDRRAGNDREYDRWAEPDREYDRRAGNDREYDRWAEQDRQYDRRAGGDREYDRWAEQDRQYDRHAADDREYDRWAKQDRYQGRRARMTGSSRSPKVKWIGLLIAWVIVAGVLYAVHLAILTWLIMIGLIAYVVRSILRDTPKNPRQRRRNTPADTVGTNNADNGREQFNPPPGWPEPPPGWTPPPGWQPNPSWPPAPPGWQFWQRPAQRSFDGRNVRIRSQRREAEDDQFGDSWF